MKKRQQPGRLIKGGGHSGDNVPHAVHVDQTHTAFAVASLRSALLNSPDSGLAMQDCNDSF
ncbi:hypothetical protein [Sphingobacterium thalpophilum]|uniref:hypothetical protein n=1 Tax=Sphingobacterium thalpophilum TaxID=259 RepID=UPI0031CEA300